MLTKNQRIILFLFVCLSMRLLLAHIAQQITIKKPQYMKYLGIIGLAIGLGFTYQFIKNKQIGALGGKVWWHSVRPVHAGIFFLFGILALLKNKDAYKLLYVDALLGLIFFIFLSNFLHFFK
jgi:hypothetical protein